MYKRQFLRNVALIFHDLLALIAHDEVDEILSHLAQPRLGGNVEGTGYLIAAVFHVGHAGLRSVDGDGLHRIVQRTQGDVADGALVAGHRGHHDAGAVGGFGGGNGLLHPEQLLKSAAGAGALLTGEDSDGARHGAAAAAGVGGVGAGGIVGILSATAGQQGRQHQGGYRTGENFFHKMCIRDSCGA